MRRLLARAALAGFAALALAAPAGAWIAQKGGAPAATSVVLAAQLTSSMSSAADRYIPVGYASSGSSTDSQQSVFPVAGAITSIRGYASVAQTGTQQWVLTLRKNGADTALTCSITSASSQRCNASTSISFAAGDLASIGIHPANTPSASGNIKVSLVFTPTSANDTPLFAQAAAMSTSTTQAVDVQSDQLSLGVLSTRRFSNMPVAGTIDKFTVASNAPGTGTSYAYTMGKNGTATALTCTIADTATACSDTTHSVSVSGPSGSTPGDDLQFQGAPANTPASATAQFGVRYVPSSAGYFALVGTWPSTDQASSTIYYPVSSSTSGGTVTESVGQSVLDHMTMTVLSIKLSVAPGSGKNRVFTVRVNGTDTALTCMVSDTATACNGSGSVAIADGDLVSIADVPSGTPNNGVPAISILAHR